MNISKLLVFVLLFGLSGCAAILSLAPDGTAISNDDTQTSWLHQAINQARQGRALSSLAENGRLNVVAQSYAEVLAKAGRLAHDGVDGTTLRMRVEASGYPFRMFNENLAAGYPNADQVIDGWLKSPGHRRNLLSAEISEVGVGYAQAGDGDKWVHYWVMVGGAPR